MIFDIAILSGLSLEEIDDMSLPIFARWKAYRIYKGQIGSNRTDYLFASLCSLLANINKAKGKRAFKAEEFLLKFGNIQLTGDKKNNSKRMELICQRLAVTWDVKDKLRKK